MRRQKATLEPEIVYWFGKLIWRWPLLWAKGAALGQYFNEVIVTNVPGPESSSALYLSDLPVKSMSPIVCLAHQSSIGIGVLSFGDQVRISVHMKLDDDGDERAVYRRQAAQTIADYFTTSFHELHDRVRAQGSKHRTGIGCGC